MAAPVDAILLYQTRELLDWLTVVNELFLTLSLRPAPLDM